MRNFNRVWKIALNLEIVKIYYMLVFAKGTIHMPVIKDNGLLRSTLCYRYILFTVQVRSIKKERSNILRVSPNLRSGRCSKLRFV